MAKIYTQTFLEETNNLKPKKQTIAFLLNYSKALKIAKYKKMYFETILN